ncbi:MAG: hypothetical protein H7X94_12870 [Vallitaleaceae bacterium]|nr:hypothetical protein [Vallitaleaceae bacterium]
MRIVEEKLERFRNDIMVDVVAQKDAVMAEFNHAYDEEFDRKETEYLTESYNIVQMGLKKIDKEKHEILSKAIMDNKMKLLNKRTEVINGVFALAEKKLKDFARSAAYFDYLTQLIEENLASIGPGDIEIYINHEDEKFIKMIEMKFNVVIHLENRNIDMIGGCKVMNKTAGLFIDDSFAKRLYDQKEGFLQNCKIQVEV